MLFTASIFLFNNNILSQNLIQNGSFESTTNPNCLTDPYNHVDNWMPISSPDYFNALCTSGGYKVPVNGFGISYPKNGNAYVGIATYYKTIEAKEYIQQHLSIPLIANKTYYVSFYVSLSDKVTYSIKNVGAYFSVSQPTVVGNTYFPATPQVQNQNGFLTDTIGWTKIESYFTAQGGEEYITIGNFNSNTNTDTLYTGALNPFIGDPNAAYYFIDSVSLYDSLDYVTNIIKNQEHIKINIYPNPNNGIFNIEYHLTKEAEFVITDITGSLVNQYALLPSQNNFSIKEDELKAGIYFYYLKQNNQVLKQDKIIVLK